ncbi:MAG: hypothetical protein C0473_01835 [Cyanobacteria bacterium DS3.002]|nr:hypothetical protein [Cyanobacteria bacterium DS3.002]MBA4049664.1 hypothetical protein [Cyanobacteria bacterium DS2.008]
MPGLKMSKFSVFLTTSLVALFSLTPCQAVPSLLCVPKTSFADTTETTESKKDNQVTARRIRVYYVNGHRQWEATALIVNDQVKTVITRGSLGRPFAKSHIDTNGFGSGIDFRGMPWEFHGFLAPSNSQRQGFTNFGSSQK